MIKVVFALILIVGFSATLGIIAQVIWEEITRQVKYIKRGRKPW